MGRRGSVELFRFRGNVTARPGAHVLGHRHSRKSAVRQLRQSLQQSRSGPDILQPKPDPQPSWRRPQRPGQCHRGCRHLPRRSPPAPVMKLPVALTIAGSDSGGGAGIQADLKTFAALGVHGTSAITAITAQNTVDVTEILELPIRMIRAQIDAVMSDLDVRAAKTGMLSSAEIIEAVAAAISDHGITQLVVDPVMVAKGGAKLLRDDAVDALRRKLLPLAAIITPNLPEAEVLLNRSIRTLDERRAAARDLRELGPRAVIVKGGHAGGDATDIYFDGNEMTELTAR